MRIPHPEGWGSYLVGEGVVEAHWMEVCWSAQVRAGPRSLGEQETALWEVGELWSVTKGAQRMPLFVGGLACPVTLSGEGHM